jgi:phage terminase large subunit-like protein
MKRIDKTKAQAAIDFIECLKHVKDPWHGCYFELLPWQKRIVSDVFGTLKSDGARQYKYAYLEIPKKQGKSELCAALALKHLCADDEHAAEVYGCAADKGQASIIFDVACEMVRQEPELDSTCKIVESRKRIIYLPTKSFYQVLSAEAFTKHGLNVSAVIFDELHAQPNRALWDVMTFGSGDARRQPIWWVITTAGDDPDRTSIGWEVHKKAESILLGTKVDPTWYPVIFGHDPDERRIWKGWTYETYGEDEKDKWKDPKLWMAVNPSLDVTVKKETVREAYISVDGNEAEERLLRQLRTNEWVKYKSSKWIPLSKWDETAGLVSWEECRGLECYGGLDLSQSTDITAFNLLFPPAGDYKKWRTLWRFWIPEDCMRERVKRDKVKYDQWVKAGLIKTTPGNVIDYDFIKADIMTLAGQYEIKEIGYDPWKALQVSLQLADEGLTMAEVRQGFKTLGPAMEQLKKLVIGCELEHGGNPVARWMFGNIEVKMDENENARPIKGPSIERIDGILALLNALDRAMRHQEKPNVYERRGMRIL